MPEMRSIVAHRYGQRELSQGELFFCEPKHVVTLIALKRAVLVEHYEELKTRELTADEPASTYRTRAMAGTLHTKRRKSSGKQESV